MRVEATLRTNATANPICVKILMSMPAQRAPKIDDSRHMGATKMTAVRILAADWYNFLLSITALLRLHCVPSCNMLVEMPTRQARVLR